MLREGAFISLILQLDKLIFLDYLENLLLLLKMCSKK